MRYLILLFIMLSLTSTVHADNLNLEIKIRFPKYESPPNAYNQFFYNKWDNVPGAVHLNIIGPYDAAISQLSQRVKGQARNILRFQYDEGGFTWFQYIKKLEAVDNDIPAYGYWWNRAWFYSLPPSKGGAPYRPIIKNYGWSWGVPDNFPILGYLKRKFRAFGDIWIDNTQEFDDIDNRNRIDNQNRSFNQKPNRETINYDRLERIPNAAIGFNKSFGASSHNWYEGMTYHFRFRPSARFRPIQSKDGILEEVSFRFLIELYTKRGSHIANLVFFARYDIPQQQTYLSVALILVKW